MSTPKIQTMSSPGTRDFRLAWFNTDGTIDTSQASVVVDLASASGKQISLQTMTVCDGTGTQKSIIVLASAPF